MWKCPNCGREFETKGQEHPCDDQPTPIDAYIAAQREDIQPLLNQVRETLRSVLPDAQEKISWRMPTYWQEHNIIHFAAHKNHMGLYPCPEAIQHFSDRLSDFKTSKGAIQLPYDRALPLDLIGEIAKWCYETGHHH